MIIAIRVAAIVIVTGLGLIGIETRNAQRIMVDVDTPPKIQFETVGKLEHSPVSETREATQPAPTSREPAPKSVTSRRPVLVLRYAYTLKGRNTSAWTTDDDPEAPYYSSLHFLRGSSRPDLYDPDRPFIKADTRPKTTDYSIAIPADRAYLFEDRMPDGRHYGHAWRIRIDGYTPA